MAKAILVDYDFGGLGRIVGLLDGVSAQDAVTVSQLRAAIEGIAWKDNVRVAAQVNTTISGPGSSINSITMSVGDRVLLNNQTAQTENGIYIWNGAAVAMTRALDASTFDELESAVVTVDEGTSAGATYRQTAVNGVIGTNNIVWTSFGTSAPAASESVAGILEIATQAETDAGTDDLRAVTPLKLKTSKLFNKSFAGNVGDGSATSYNIDHNLNTRDVIVRVYRNSGNYDDVECDIQRSTVNRVILVFAAAPTTNQHRVVIQGTQN